MLFILYYKVCDQFVICDGCTTDGPYETTSVMHYNSEGFACDPQENVVLKKDGGYIKYNDDTTRNDLNMIKNFYQCWLDVKCYWNKFYFWFNFKKLN